MYKINMKPTGYFIRDIQPRRIVPLELPTYTPEELELIRLLSSAASRYPGSLKILWENFWICGCSVWM